MTRQRAAGGGGGGGGAARRDAKALFTSGDADTGATACGACHTLADAGATGTVGPDLDKVLKGKDAAFIQQSIVDPERGDRAGLPARHHARRTSAIRCRTSQVDALVKYLPR